VGYGDKLVDAVYRIYLNHSKVIHFRRGLPVFSLMTPALFSSPAANFIARAMFRTIQNRNLPNLMTLAVNDECNAACEHCSFFDAVDQPGRAVLDLAQARKLLADAQDLGVSVINIAGGEPLLRDDLPELLAAIDKRRSTTILFTNGWHLAERVGALARSGLDSVYANLEFADAERHDAFCHLPGLFDRAREGLQAARRLGLSVGIAATLTEQSFRDGELARIVELAREWGVHEVFVFDAVPSGRYQDREDLLEDSGWTEAMIASATTWNDDSRYPGVAFHAYMSSHRSVGCACGTSYFYVSPYGDVMSCDFNHARFGNVLEDPLWKGWERLSTTPGFAQAKWGGCKIKDRAFRQLDTVVAGRP
jgi:MoaA/NifB/PqqE/SkfB family radical SAM enzyme